MIRVFPASTIAHPWRPALATLALTFYAAVAWYLLFTVALPWATGHLGQPWSFTRIGA